MTVSYSTQHPDESLNAFVFSFWKTENEHLSDCQYTVFPDAGIELIAYVYPDRPVRIRLFGLSTQAIDVTVPGRAVLFGVRFTLLGADYSLPHKLTINSSQEMAEGFWDVDVDASTTLNDFANAVSTQIRERISTAAVDSRKKKLLARIHSAEHVLSVRKLSVEVGWGERQINRYFTKTFGLPLKRYMEQLAFFASMKQLGGGQFVHPHYYYDQSHFIRQVKRYTGTTPNQIYQKRNDRFLQLSDQSANPAMDAAEGR